MEDEDLEDPSPSDEIPDLPENDAGDEWLSELADDPYVTESEMIINDLVQQLHN